MALPDDGLTAKLLPFNASIFIPPEHNAPRQAQRLEAARICGVTPEHLENYAEVLRVIHARRDAAARPARVTKLNLVRRRTTEPET
jgi:hypothetical protein